MLQDLLDEAASRWPGHSGIVYEGGSASYAELREGTLTLSRTLRTAGLRSGDRVLVLWENSPQYVVLFFSILEAGGVVVPLNPSNTSGTVRYVAEHSGARIAAATGRANSCLEGWWKGAVLSARPDSPEGLGFALNGDPALPARDSVFPSSGEDAPAMILYTSGTTGKPKGVVLSHRNLDANTESILRYLDLGPSDRTLAVLPFFYSYGNSLLLTHVSVGATLVVETKFALVSRALDTMRRHRVTGFSGVPSHFAFLFNRSKFLEGTWPDLRYMTCAGGGLPPAYVKRIRERLPHVRIHVMYGQTEGAARLSSLPPGMLEGKLGSIGKGIPGVSLRVVREDGGDVRPGEVGEIVAKGANIMLGYLGDPEATGETVRNGWLHTGDLATVDEDGYIFIKGRAKEFIKSGGYRIGPQQIEEVALEFPPVSECAVVGVPDEWLEEKIVMFVVPRDGADPEDVVKGLTPFLKERLPAYMVPGAVTVTGALPKTESGKIRRMALRDIAVGGPSVARRD